MSKTVIGQIVVDSGQAMIGDPCYLDDWKTWDSETTKFEERENSAGEYGYLGACNATLGNGFGGLGAGVNGASNAFVFSLPDGYYPIYAVLNEDGDVDEISVKIKGGTGFTYDDEDEDKYEEEDEEDEEDEEEEEEDEDLVSIIPFESKCEILGTFWYQFKEDEDLKAFISFNDVGLPLAWFISIGVVAPLSMSEGPINETFAMFLDAMELTEEDVIDVDNLDDLLAIVERKKGERETQ
jgi:hypothetical protein